MRHDQAKETRKFSIGELFFSKHNPIRSRATALVIWGKIRACSDWKPVEFDIVALTVRWESISDALITRAVVLWIAVVCEGQSVVNICKENIHCPFLSGKLCLAQLTALLIVSTEYCCAPSGSLLAIDVIRSDNYRTDGIMRTAALDWLSDWSTLRKAAIGITYTQRKASLSG